MEPPSGTASRNRSPADFCGTSATAGTEESLRTEKIATKNSIRPLFRATDKTICHLLFTYSISAGCADKKLVKVGRKVSFWRERLKRNDFQESDLYNVWRLSHGPVDSQAVCAIVTADWTTAKTVTSICGGRNEPRLSALATANINSKTQNTQVKIFLDCAPESSWLADCQYPVKTACSGFLAVCLNKNILDRTKANCII